MQVNIAVDVTSGQLKSIRRDGYCTWAIYQLPTISRIISSLIKFLITNCGYGISASLVRDTDYRSNNSSYQLQSTNIVIAYVYH